MCAPGDYVCVSGQGDTDDWADDMTLVRHLFSSESEARSIL